VENLEPLARLAYDGLWRAARGHANP
jgi:hypothetical protein